MLRVVGMERRGSLQIPVARRETPLVIRIERQPAGIRVELDWIEVPSVVVRLAPIKERTFQLPPVGVNAGCDNAEADVGRVLPVVTDGCNRVVHRRWTMHERYRA